jgi:hypothetical protein
MAQCQVCINRLAVARATHRRNRETWLVCGSCRDRGIKLRANVAYEDLKEDDG